jgi:chromosome segregation ATPase
VQLDNQINGKLKILNKSMTQYQTYSENLANFSDFEADQREKQKGLCTNLADINQEILRVEQDNKQLVNLNKKQEIQINKHCHQAPVEGAYRGATQ